MNHLIHFPRLMFRCGLMMIASTGIFSSGIFSSHFSWGRPPAPVVCQTSNQANPSPAQRRKIAQIKKEIRKIERAITKAGNLFKNEKFAPSAKLISAAQEQLTELAKSPSPDALELLAPVQQRLAKAHQLLSQQGQQLDPLQPLPQPVAKGDTNQPDETKNQTSRVSFVSDVVPVFVRNCGSCHVNRRLGGFAAASFTALDASGVVAPGLADNSRIIEVIASGEMPPNGRQVAPDQLKIMKDWINAGAKFDGQNPAENLNRTLQRNQAKRQAASDASKITAPTGNETVSFGLHVAPVLLENCAQCHIRRNPRGNFSMANFRSFFRGGSTGNPVKPGNSAESEIILRLKGIGRDVMPPSGKIDDAKIEQIAKWIDEGAKFDPADQAVEMAVVASKALAQSLDHAELVQMRKTSSAQAWRLALDGVGHEKIATDNFLILGTGSKQRLEKIGKQAELLAAQVAKVLKTPAEPWVRGNTTLFVVDKRYDFSEIGRMIERRELPKFVRSTWRFNVTDAWVAMLIGFDDAPDRYQAELARDIAAVQVASWDPSVPRWFADGMGYVAAAKLFFRSEQVVQWNAAAGQIAGSMKSANDLLDGKMPGDQASLAGFQFVKILRQNSRSFARFLKELQSNKNFDQAFLGSFGATPQQFFGKPQNRRQSPTW